MVSTCFRGRSPLGACLEKTQKKRRSQPVDTTPLKKKIPPYRVMSHCVTSLLPPHSKSHSVSFFALMWPEVERCSTSKCVGPSIIPPCKYLHKETSPLAPAGQKKKSPVPGTVFARRAIYSYDRSRGEEASQRGRWRGWWEERREG